MNTPDPTSHLSAREDHPAPVKRTRLPLDTGGLGGDNSFNELLSVDNDGRTLFLKPLGMHRRFYGQSQKDQQLTQQGAAEAYWG